MLERFANVFRIPELRRRMLFTVLLLAATRIGVFIPVPNIDASRLAEFFKRASESAGGDLLGVVNLFAGGALENAAIFGLGVMPYISASIIFQLLASVIPSLEKLRKEGEAGRRKLNQYTRYATVALCFFQGMIIIGGLRSQFPDIFPPEFGFASTMFAALLMTCGTLLLMWIGEQIDEYGIGNGMSLIIMVSILARMPFAVRMIAEYFEFSLTPAYGQIGIPKLVVMLALFFAVIVGVIFVTRGQRRIPFQQAKQTRGRRVYGGMKHYLPLGVNAAGVLPIIFAQSLLMFPSMFLNPLAQAEIRSDFWRGVITLLNDSLQIGSFIYTMIYIVLIFFFCYFWTAIQFNPTEMADNLKEHGSFIPGIRPGKRTAEHLERIMNRITLPGAAFLALIAIMPSIAARVLGVPQFITAFYGGTTLLIIVGVALDLVRQIESELLMRHYEGLTRGGRRRR
jgi:preprotein translocase subunit SecY